MVREIPSLFVLCLRAVGSHDCKAQVTFADENNKTTSASKLLRAFHRRPAVQSSDEKGGNHANNIHDVALTRIPIVGTVRRAHANDVDINHPMIAAAAEKEETLVMQYGNPALDCLQAYIDALVELGRMDDTRLTQEFFREWIRCCNIITKPKTKKRKRSTPSPPPPPAAISGGCSSMSLQNCSIAEVTFENMVKTGVGPYLSVLDLAGISTLTNDHLDKLLESCHGSIQRLSLKNCRRLTSKALQHVATHCPLLVSLDIGGSFNMSPQQVLEVLPNLKNLVELHASGLGWTDHTVMELVSSVDNPWEGLSLGFSTHPMALSTFGLQKALVLVKDTLQRLAIPFCDAVDNAFLGWLGKTMPLLSVLDVRGNSNINSLTGWYDGRAAACLESSSPEEDLFVLARYTSISNSSVEETKRIHPLHTSQLTCVLDGGGTGGGIRR